MGGMNSVNGKRSRYCELDKRYGYCRLDGWIVFYLYCVLFLFTANVLLLSSVFPIYTAYIIFVQTVCILHVPWPFILIPFVQAVSTIYSLYTLSTEYSL